MLLTKQSNCCLGFDSFPFFPLLVSPHLSASQIAFLLPSPPPLLPSVLFSLLVLEDDELAPAFNRDLPVMKPLCLYSEPAQFPNWIGCSLSALFLLPSCFQHGSGFLYYLLPFSSQYSTLCAWVRERVFSERMQTLSGTGPSLWLSPVV